MIIVKAHNGLLDLASEIINILTRRRYFISGEVVPLKDEFYPTTTVGEDQIMQFGKRLFVYHYKSMPYTTSDILVVIETLLEKIKHCNPTYINIIDDRYVVRNLTGLYERNDKIYMDDGSIVHFTRLSLQNCSKVDCFTDIIFDSTNTLSAENLTQVPRCDITMFKGYQNIIQMPMKYCDLKFLGDSLQSNFWRTRKIEFIPMAKTLSFSQFQLREQQIAADQKTSMRYILTNNRAVPELIMCTLCLHSPAFQICLEGYRFYFVQNVPVVHEEPIIRNILEEIHTAQEFGSHCFKTTNYIFTDNISVINVLSDGDLHKKNIIIMESDRRAFR